MKNMKMSELAGLKGEGWIVRMSVVAKKTFCLLALASLLANASTQTPQTQPSAKPTAKASTAAPARAEYAKTLDKVIKLIEENFYDSKFQGLNWKAIKDEARQNVDKVQTSEQFSELINKMLADLKASHAGFFTPDDLEYSMLKSVFAGKMEGFEVEHIGALFTKEARGYRLKMLLDGLPAQESDLRVGDLILSANGKPFHPVKSFKNVSNPVKLKVERGGSAFEVSIASVKGNLLHAFYLATQRSVRVIEQGGKRIGYIRLWCQSHPKFLELLKEVVQNRFADTDAFILDLRDGYGGSPKGYADMFFLPSSVIEWKSRRGTNVEYGGYGKPLIALINQGTRSAKEMLAFQLKAGKRATLIGSTTAGHVLGATGIDVNPYGLLELPVVDLKVDGQRLEGIGVSPDIEVKQERDATGKDLTLDRALVYLYAQMNRNAPAP